jgi:hypothetical protein
MFRHAQRSQPCIRVSAWRVRISSCSMIDCTSYTCSLMFSSTISMLCLDFKTLSSHWKRAECEPGGSRDIVSVQSLQLINVWRTAGVCAPCRICMIRSSSRRAPDSEWSPHQEQERLLVRRSIKPISNGLAGEIHPKSDKALVKSLLHMAFPPSFAHRHGLPRSSFGSHLPRSLRIVNFPVVHLRDSMIFEVDERFDVKFYCAMPVDG